MMIYLARADLHGVKLIAPSYPDALRMIQTLYPAAHQIAVRLIGRLELL